MAGPGDESAELDEAAPLGAQPAASRPRIVKKEDEAFVGDMTTFAGKGRSPAYRSDPARASARVMSRSPGEAGARRRGQPAHAGRRAAERRGSGARPACGPVLRHHVLAKERVTADGSDPGARERGPAEKPFDTGARGGASFRRECVCPRHRPSS